MAKRGFYINMHTNRKSCGSKGGKGGGKKKGY